MQAIASELGLTRERVRQIALRGDVTAATYRQLLPPSKAVIAAREIEARQIARVEQRAAQDNEVIGLRVQGLNQKEIGKKLGISQKWVSTILIRASHRTKDQPIRIFSKPKRKRRAKNTRVGAPLFVSFPDARKVPHDDSVVLAARRLWDSGLSAQRIALELTSEERDLSKNAIIGIAHRNYFPARPSPIRRAV